MVLGGEIKCRVLVEWYWEGKYSVEYWWKCTGRGNTVYSIGGMVKAVEIECRLLLEIYWQGKQRVDYWWKGTGRGNRV